MCASVATSLPLAVCLSLPVSLVVDGAVNLFTSSVTNARAAFTFLETFSSLLKGNVRVKM